MNRLCGAKWFSHTMEWTDFDSQTEVNIPMATRTITVPNISCSHCTRTIEMELKELQGVTRVQADPKTKKVTVAWEAPLEWKKISDLLSEINFPPAKE